MQGARTQGQRARAGQCTGRRERGAEELLGYRARHCANVCGQKARVEGVIDILECHLYSEFTK
jgi:hypothetical protein